MHAADASGRNHGLSRRRLRGVLRLRTSPQERRRAAESSRNKPGRCCMSHTVSPAIAPQISPEEWRGKVMHKCRESVEVKQNFFEHYAEQIGELSQKMAARFQAGRTLWVMGN